MLSVFTLAGAFATTVGAAPGAAAPTSDYASFPQLPASCAGGSGALNGLEFSNGRDSANDLRSLGVHQGDTITMRWSGPSDGCRDVAVSMAAYRAESVSFDPATNEDLLVWTSCGADGTGCGTHSLSLTLSNAQDACYGQLDAVVGAPLAVIGPKGSYFNNLYRNDDRPNMLISASNYGEGCKDPVPPTTVPPTTVPPATVPPATVPPATVPPTTVTPLSVPPTTPPPTVLEALPQPKTLPVTGANAQSRTLLSLTLTAIGFGLVGSSRRVTKPA